MNTLNGYKLAHALLPSIGQTPAIVATCSLLCRAARTYGRLQVTACNRELTERERKRDESAAERINELVLQLPLVDGQFIKADLNGDPRGATVKLILPDGRFDDWGGEGICVPGS